MTFGSLFSGIGGMDLGLERAGLSCRYQVEIEPHHRAVLAKHWPHVERFEDVTEFPPKGQDPSRFAVDVLAGGFPCQDLSVAGRGKGLAGERSGLWWEFARIIRLLRPRYIVVENVPGLLVPPKGKPKEQAAIGCVTGELARLGYDAEWQTVPASAVGAAHQRFRVFLVAYPAGHGDRFRVLSARPWPEWEGAADAAGFVDELGAHPPGDGRAAGRRGVGAAAGESEPAGVRGRHRLAAKVGGERLQAVGLPRRPAEEVPELARRGEQPADADGVGGRSRRKRGVDPFRQERADAGKASPFAGAGWWRAEPPLVRMVHGVPRRLVRDAIRGLGNAVVPQLAEWVGRCLLRHAQQVNDGHPH